MSGWPDTRNIDDISSIFRDIFYPNCDQAKNKCFLKITSEVSFKNCYIKSINELKWSFLLSIFKVKISLQ